MRSLTLAAFLISLPAGAQTFTTPVLECVHQNFTLHIDFFSKRISMQLLDGTSEEMKAVEGKPYSDDGKPEFAEPYEYSMKAVTMLRDTTGRAIGSVPMRFETRVYKRKRSSLVTLRRAYYVAKQETWVQPDKELPLACKVVKKPE
jgi:hypothetical protein